MTQIQDVIDGQHTDKPFDVPHNVSLLEALQCLNAAHSHLKLRVG
jgi:hypothetical protein